MTTKIKALVLDLDDTLYAEINYLESAYRFIAAQISAQPQQLSANMLAQYHAGENVFENISKIYQIDKSKLLDWYRFHKPDITLFQDVAETLNHFTTDYMYAVITDGRSETQRNKLQALGLTDFLSSIVISEEIGSEKPSLVNYKKVMSDLQCEQYIYVGDNLKKDFVTAKRLGWTTICLKDQGQNIHTQNFSIAEEYQADHYFNSWQEIREFLSSR
ncbi:HAD family hydrolase [Acinetobacter lwoffii]|uniref:HAD family hydrolase n=1 Tax=Acinetobacter lwoffii TaxID=28090 RepID=UPI003F8D6BC7